MKFSFKKLNSFFLTVIILVSFTAQISSAEVKIPEISAEAAVLIEIESGKVLYQKDANSLKYPASTTKIMTALLALERLDLNKVITVPDDMGPAEGSAMYLLPGESFTVRQLLDALLVKSANDAAILLARTMAPDVPSFAKLMNERAKEIGTTTVNFTNPNGLHEPEHVTSAYDMALIAREAMKNDIFRQLISQVNVTLDETAQTPEKRYFRNTNRFLWSASQIIYNNEYIPIKYDVVDGIKTGTTKEAGNCLVSSGYKNGIRVIAVVFKAQGFDVYRDSRILLDYGFDNFVSKKIIDKTIPLGSEKIKFSNPGTVAYSTKSDYIIPYMKNENPVINTQIVLNEPKLPILEDDIIGKVLITNNKISEELPLYALNSAQSIFSIDYIINWLGNNILKISIFLFGGILAIASLLLLMRFFITHSHKKRRKRKKYRNIY